MNLGTRMHLPPMASMEWMDTPRPKPWNTGMTASILSPGLNMGLVAMICCASALKFRLVREIPFWVPVVPPE